LTIPDEHVNHHTAVDLYLSNQLTDPLLYITVPFVTQRLIFTPSSAAELYLSNNQLTGPVLFTKAASPIKISH